MAERVLRDHSEPCKHYDPVIAGPDPSKDQISGQTYLLGHVVIGSPGGFWCPGGREVTIDYGRVEEILLELCGDWYDMVIREGRGPFDFGAAMRALDAAIGDGDDGGSS